MKTPDSSFDLIFQGYEISIKPLVAIGSSKSFKQMFQMKGSSKYAK